MIQQLRLKLFCLKFPVHLAATICFLAIFGWYAHSEPLISWTSNGVPIQFNTALGYLFACFSYLMFFCRQFSAASFMGILTALIGLLSITENFVNIGLADFFFPDPWLSTFTILPGLMSPEAAFSLILNGIFATILPLKLPTKTFMWVIVGACVAVGSQGLLNTSVVNFNDFTLMAWPAITCHYLLVINKVAILKWM